ncbi:hypothetical protein GQ43DRAFT_381852 [Delitschia confertaspora ATCC 74209]|uniref:DUF6594 domain-containing protein n=1 Tax=Delitschia confertaspora ATCC 74209 TaxID=1513339 RepID=A0A9P4MLH0_9PLEO|nr:hypothetical protein GQ43DRAFT_381852 [Delitschia confertaspora ATCC 74209]
MAAAVQLPQHYQQYPPGPDLSKKTVIGYELVADKLTEVPKDDYESRTETRVVPMYRKFERLNHRVLLHLQDEISELEEELRYLDECIAQQSPSVQLGHIQPASRRAETRHGGEMHHRRTLLLGNIYTKLGQYNSALSSFSTMKKNLAPADPSEIRAYHKWMQKHAPIEQTETRFLEHKDDLLNLSGRNQTDSESTTATATATGGVGGVAGLAQSAVIGLPLILVLPLMAFALIPGLLGRLFIIGVVGAVEVAVVTSSVELMGFMTVKEWLYAASM